MTLSKEQINESQGLHILSNSDQMTHINERSFTHLSVSDTDVSIKKTGKIIIIIINSNFATSVTLKYIFNIGTRGILWFKITLPHTKLSL